ncbi:MAG: VOC family protein [Bauldia sp.]
MDAASTPVGIERFQQVSLPVADLDRAVSFYRDKVGLRLIATFDPPGLAFLDVGGVRLLLSRSKDAKPSSGTLYLRVADIDAAERALTTRGVAFEHRPALVHRDTAGQFGPAGSEEWMAFLRDPDGHLLSIAATKPAR